jgi:hypothetical protein
VGRSCTATGRRGQLTPRDSPGHHTEDSLTPSELSLPAGNCTPTRRYARMRRAPLFGVMICVRDVTCRASEVHRREVFGDCASGTVATASNISYYQPPRRRHRRMVPLSQDRPEPGIQVDRRMRKTRAAWPSRARMKSSSCVATPGLRERGEGTAQGRTSRASPAAVCRWARAPGCRSWRLSIMAALARPEAARSAPPICARPRPWCGSPA